MTGSKPRARDGVNAVIIANIKALLVEKATAQEQRKAAARAIDIAAVAACLKATDGVRANSVAEKDVDSGKDNNAPAGGVPEYQQPTE